VNVAAKTAFVLDDVRVFYTIFCIIDCFSASYCSKVMQKNMDGVEKKTVRWFSFGR
jgi:hypothetical protein